ncbi:MAG: cobaltochelatase subunit CobN [Rhodospirillales bacterium]
MHLLAAQPGAVSDGSEAVDLGQSPGDIIFISAADSELALVARARAALDAPGACPGAPSLRLANLMRLSHNLSVDLYVDSALRGAKLVIARVLGGCGYWPYGLEQIAEACRASGAQLCALPGDDQPDPELDRLSTIPAEARTRLWRYLINGGPENAEQFLRFAFDCAGTPTEWVEPRPLPAAGFYWPEHSGAVLSLDDVRAAWARAGLAADAPACAPACAPRCAVVFYRALFQAQNLKPVDALTAALMRAGLAPVPVFVQSLKDPVSAALVSGALAETEAAVVLNATGFSVSAPGAPRTQTPFDAADCPVLQVVFSGSSKESWEAGTAGLSPRDIAMNVALPEVDGRVLTRAVSFKGAARRDALTETDIIEYDPAADRIDFTAALAAAWARLRQTPAPARRTAVVLANYPNRDARMGNGVGLDAPEGVVTALRAMAEAGYNVDGAPQTGAELIARLKRGPTNDFTALAGREVSETLALSDYRAFFSELSASVQSAVTARWGEPESDPFVMKGAAAFAVPAFVCGNTAIALQPARGYNINPAESYHDPALVPPHNYLAFYAWVRRAFGAHAVIHFGKHGNLEWLPGKALALSDACFPEAALGPLPNLYPFIVNDPGEGAQAKRRAAAVIIDHLTPPLTRAESYGPLRDLEQLVDEYFEASGVDPRRLKVLSEDILLLMAASGLDKDLGVEGGVEGGADTAAALGKLDGYLCELKELQIRDGLHVFGAAPEGALLDNLLTALVRVPRGGGAGAEASLHRALAADFGLADFDPLDCDMAAPWAGPRPAALADIVSEPWRTNGDTVERIEALALALIAGETAPGPAWPRAAAVLDYVRAELRPAVTASGAAELSGLLAGLSGRFVAPGPSGAPTRGRPDVLPTGRNFYSVDPRTAPTPAAWRLGWDSAARLVELHRQTHGEWPRAVGISAWGTSNMRTGGDDIAQALALIGARPLWDTASRRVTGFEVLPQSVLGRPRVDVTLRISGFFRDAFPALIDLFDSAVRAVAALGAEEDETANPIAARVMAERSALEAEGVDSAEAALRAGFRVFGSRPGAYGAGLQALIDEKGWETDADLARAYTAWGGYAYGQGAHGAPRHGLFERRLAALDAVIHNQDNREHDLLDSDDYYQFQGGMTAAARVLSGAQPAVYHADHSRPETPRIRTLADEIARVVRARVVNPKWIEGVMRHGYKGAFEMAASVDYLFAFAATARAVGGHHFDLVFDAYLDDAHVRGFLARENPDALKDIAAKLLEAQDRGLWTPRRNSARAVLEALAAGEG